MRSPPPRRPESASRKTGPRPDKAGPGKSAAPAKSAANISAPNKPASGKPHAGKSGRRPDAPRDLAILFGTHSVREALRSSRRKCLRLYATAGAAERLSDEIAASGVTLSVVSPADIEARLPRDAVHQGLLLEARPLEPIDLSDLSGKGIVLVLDQVTDPHNVGAIIRTAAAFNVEAIVTTERHTPELTGILAKSASGGLEHVAIASVVNLARALEELGDLGYQRVGLDSEGPADLKHTPLSAPVALVLGAEGKGLRRLSRENCDVLARLDMPGAIKSLNVSNACAVALALVWNALHPA